MITGATGYVALHVVKRFLDAGLTIHAPIRGVDNKEKTKYLDEMAAKSTGAIKYFEADLLKPGSYDDAAKGCELVVHTASPFILTTKEPQRDLLDPALKGTENVLNAVNKAGDAKRVVLTSSVAAIYGDAKDLLEYPNQTMTENDWNTTGSVNHSPYSWSKTIAEKRAWEMAEAQNQWDLVVVNPCLVIGPAINPKGTSESINIFRQLGNGDMKMGAANIELGCVDVRDVAEGHFQAAFTPGAKGRHILLTESLSFLEVADLLRDKFSDYPLPKKNLPKWLVWLSGPMVGVPRQFVKNNVSYKWRADNSKSKRELGMKYRSLKPGAQELFQLLADMSAFSKN